MEDIAQLSDQQVLALLGKRLRKARLRRDFTQEELAQRASLSVSTIKGLEAGKGRLDSLIAVLRELKQLDGLNQFIPEPPVSPLQLAKREGKSRKRASGSRKRSAPSAASRRRSSSKSDHPSASSSHSPKPHEDDEYSW